MTLDLRSTPVRLAAAAVGVSIVIALFWDLLPPYGLGPPFGLPSTIVLLADIVALFVLVSAAVTLVAALTGWVVEIDRTATRRWQGVTPMSLGFYLARHGGAGLAPSLDDAARGAVLSGLQSILDRGDSAVFAMVDGEGFVDRVIVTTPVPAATVRQWAARLSAGAVSRASRVDRAELGRRYPGMFGLAWWIGWEPGRNPGDTH